jgi:hypothetical protein
MAATPEAVLTQQDFNLIPVLNLVAETVAGSVTPSSANVGKIYRNSSSGRIEYVKNATTVVSLPESGGIVNADIAVGAAIALSKLATDPLARANHTGTQVAATISDLASVVQAYRLDQFAAPTGSVSMGSQKITSLADGVGATDATTLQQVQNLIAAIVNGHDWKDAVRVATTTNVTISSPGSSLDGVTMASGDRVLLAGQSTGSQNGIYVWNGAASAMTRATDADASAEVTSGLTVPVTGGTKASQMAILTTGDPITLGTTSLAFTFLANAAAYVQGTGITITGNTVSLTVPVTVALGGTNATDAPTARTNLNVPQRGAAGTLGAITAGGTTTFAHNLGTQDVTVQVYRISDGATVRIGTARTDANTITIASDVAVTTGTLRCVVEPIA